ncbi:Cytochrome c oxidase assembly protein cox11, mitochondrial, partial [Xenoophorus captivus]
TAADGDLRKRSWPVFKFPVRENGIFSVLNLSLCRWFLCFCFEEQRLNPHEEVDMPVFFYIDPEFDDDPRMARVDTITLSYTFFEAKEGQQLPLPGYSYN